MKRLLVVLALALSGCATISPAPPVVPPVADRVPVQNWTMQGRISIRTGPENLSGQIRWQHRTASDDMILTSPLGQGVARIVRDASGVTLEAPNQPVRRAADAEALTRAVLGYGLPVAGLTWWVQGLPAPGRAFEARRDSSGRIEQIRQDGWVIDLLQYADAPPYRLRKLALVRDDLEIRLVADTWQVE